PHDHIAARRSRDTALDYQQMVVRIDAQDLQVPNRHAAASHAARRAPALDDAGGKGWRADRHGCAMEHGPVGGCATAEVMSPDDALITFAAAGPNHIYAVATVEDRHQHLIAWLQAVAARSHFDLSQNMSGGHVRPLVVADQRLGHLRRPLLYEPELHGLIAVGLR